ncbi:MAG: Fpg/Nei family DNA glycosylase [Methanobacterium sp.]|nr:Fpg/Nei family DNA glycosylase [Methanobacterium sp.]
MPELPSVEIFKRYFDSTSLKQEIDVVDIINPEILADVSEVELEDKLQGREFIESRRYGKYLFVHLDNNYSLILHFGMTGYLKYFKKMGSSHIRLLICFKNGFKLAFDDMRKFGKVGLTKNQDLFIREKKLGPDALEIDYRTFEKLFTRRKGLIKPLLMNQNFIAGIGNLYADEILYQSSIHPLSRANKLDKEKLKEIYDKMKIVLNRAIEYQDKPYSLPMTFLLPHRHPNGECPQGGPLEIIKIAGRTTYFCPEHQEFIS